MLKLTQQELTIDAAGPNGMPRRTLAGLALPYNVEATVNDGTKVMFMPGSLNSGGKMPKLYLGHDSTQAVGLVTAMVDTPGGMMYEARISETTLGNEALVLAADGVLDAVSVGVNPTRFSYDEAGTMIIESADWQELSLVPFGAFQGASVDRVSASQSIPQEPVKVDIIETETPNEELDTMTQPTETPQVIEAASVAPVVYAQPRTFKLPTPAEYISAFFQGGLAFENVQAAIRAGAPDVITTDTPGILPTPIVSPTYNNFIGNRPVVDAVGVKAMPGGGKVFIRPEVTTNVSQAVQSAENAALQAGTFVVSSNQVTKGTYGGYVTISEQDLDWTEPAVLALLLDDMARIYANTTDNVAADNLKTGATVTAAFGNDATDPAQWASFVTTAAQTILSGSNGNLPTHLFVSPNMWGYLMGLVDTTGRPLFPSVGPMNAYGNLQPGQPNGTAFGLSVCVDRNFETDTVIVGDSSGYEIFEQQRGAISVDVPSTLSRTIAWRGTFATLMIDASKFVKATF